MLNDFKTVSCLGYDLFNDTLANIPLDKKLIVNTINQYSYCIAEEDNAFKNALKQADILLPDGVGITFASWFLNGIKIKKIAGADIHQNLLERLNDEGGTCFYLGSSQETLNLIQERMKRDCPNVLVASYSPPYKKDFSKEDSKIMIDHVNKFRPNILFVGMTAPKQEKWSDVHKNELDANIICSIGAVFDFYAGKVKRPHKILVKFGLEWLGRLIKEPKRMWERYIYYGSIYVVILLRKKWKFRKS